MKIIKFLIPTVAVLLLSIVGLRAAEGGSKGVGEVDVDVLWERGNRLYSAGDYNGAVATYDSIVQAGWESAPLYYNLAGAYFKAGKSGRAILNYNRAARLAPGNDDVAYNLAYAESFVKDKIDAVPQFAVSRWVVFAGNLMSADAWGVVSLVLLGVAMVALLFYLLSIRRSLRKAGFIVTIVSSLMMVISVLLGAKARQEIVTQSEAIVLSSAAVVKASPERTSKDLFILHEGTKVEVLDEFGEWTEVRIADGNEGWIRTSSIEII